jgi:response regulator of citrate/malate metabolism
MYSQAEVIMEILNNSNVVNHQELKGHLARYLNILIVEDDITSEPIWDFIFSQLDPYAKISWATSVVEAEEILDSSINEGKCFDLILADIFLSGSLTGVDLWVELQEGMPNLIILMSASEPAKIKKYFKNLGSVKYLQKPLNIHETIEILRETLSQNQALKIKEPNQGL